MRAPMTTAIPRTLSPATSILARVAAGPDLDAAVVERSRDRVRAADRARRTVESREDAVARRIYEGAGEPRDFSLRELVVGTDELLPAGVAELSQFDGRIDDVGEQDGGEHAVGLDGRPFHPEEITDGVEDRILVARPRRMVFAWQLDEPSAGDLRGEPAPLRQIGDPIPRCG